MVCAFQWGLHVAVRGRLVLKHLPLSLCRHQSLDGSKYCALSRFTSRSSARCFGTHAGISTPSLRQRLGVLRCRPVARQNSLTFQPSSSNAASNSSMFILHLLCHVPIVALSPPNVRK